ncbi:unnamed protein product [uncultured bacterium]|nr:unnamed protein product [uncultured bacterium]
MTTRVVGIVQPTYLPWLPFFERMARSDIFIYLDDVQYSKNSFHNRNAVKGPQGPILLTVPVRRSGNTGALISDIRTDDRSPWRRKHWQTIRQNYAHAPHFRRYADELEALFAATTGTLTAAIMPFIEFLRRELGIQTPCLPSSQLAVSGARNQKLVNLCHAVDGTHFIVKPGTEDYHPPEDFAPHGIAFRLFRSTPLRYPQPHGDFLPGLSALDFVLNCGPDRFMETLAAQAPHE